MTSAQSRSIAIVGIGCRFPGGADTPEAFWTLLSNGVDAIGDLPGDRFDLQRFYDARPQIPGKTVARYGGYLSGIDQFDADFFELSPREAERVDPQQRLLLETAWEAFEDAGVDVAGLERRRVGVFVGQWLSDFEQRLFLHPEEIDFSMTLGSGRYAASGRIAYAFGFIGPSITLDTACSSSLSAVHLAVQSLRSGESDVALAGGVNVILAPHIHIAYSQSGMIAPDGRCKFGDARADGYVRSEGAGLFVLKRLSEALRDGDRIHAVIRGSALNNDGRTSGSLGTPSQAGQEDLLRRALSDAGVLPLEVGYVEAHGTGTRAGDKVEIGALAAVLGQGRTPSEPLLVGSVKTNIGHTEGAAGAAGLIKAALAVREGLIPASLNLETPNPDVPWAAAPLQVPCAATPWAAPIRRAGVSGFGIAGANAHIVLEAPPQAARQAPDAAPLPLLILSARSEDSLRLLAAGVADQLLSAGGPNLADLVGFSQTRRTPLARRAAFLARDKAQLAGALRVFADGGAALAEGEADPRRPTKAALIFPGQGGQWAGMARDLLDADPKVRTFLERADAVIRAEAGWSLLEQLSLEPNDAAYAGERIDVVQPALGAVCMAYAEWLKAAGLPFEAVAGHSMGEAAAAYVAGALSLEDALKVLCRRSRLMAARSGEGAMALVDLPEADVARVLAGFEGRVSVAAINSPRACIISGDRDAVIGLVAKFEADGIFSRRVKVDVASHSPHMEAPARALEAELGDLTPLAAQVPFVSALMGREAAGAELDASYWARNLREPVRFADALAELSARGVAAFLEVGPHPVLTPSIEQAVQGAGPKASALCTGRRDEPEADSLLGALAQLWCAGVAVNWARGAAAPAKVVDFPRYPWRRRRLWVQTAELARTRMDSRVRREPDEETRAWVHRTVWRELPDPAEPQAAGAWLIVGEAPDLAAALAAAGASVDQAPLSELQARLARLGAHAVPINVAIVAPPGPEAPFLPVRAAQALAQGVAARLWFVTSGAQDPDKTARLDVDHAALWGAARVLSDERPDIWGGLLDLAPSAVEPLVIQAAANRILTPDGADQIVIRGERAFAPRLTSGADATGSVLEWRADASYLLTGGLGEVGLAVAKAMVEEGARRLVLLGRTGLPPRREWARLDPASRDGRRAAAIRDLEEMGAAVRHEALDVADEAAVRTFLDDYAAEGWPPIRGIVHLAAVLDRRLVAETTPEAFEAALSAKLRSAQLLDRLLPDLDSFVLFSSMSTLLPQPGMAAYAAANLGLEALASDRRARGGQASCIAWGGWRGAGLIGDDGGQANMAELARQGVGTFPAREGAALVSWAAGREGANIAVIPVDWAAYAKARVGRPEPLLQELKGGFLGGALADRLAEAKGPEKLTILAQIVTEAVARTLHLEAGDLDPQREFGAMGLTSLLAMELRNRLERATARPLAATLAWNYPTVAALSAHLADEGVASARSQEPTSVTLGRQAIGEKIAAVNELSDGEALAALRQRRKGARP